MWQCREPGQCRKAAAMPATEGGPWREEQLSLVQGAKQGGDGLNGVEKEQNGQEMGQEVQRSVKEGRWWHPEQVTCIGCYPHQRKRTSLLCLLRLVPAIQLLQIREDPMAIEGLQKRKGAYFPFPRLLISHHHPYQSMQCRIFPCSCIRWL